MPADVRGSVDRYRPKLLTVAQWANWGDSVVACVEALGPQTPKDGIRLLTMLAAFAADLDRLGKEPPLETHLTLRLIEWHVNERPPGSAATRRSELQRIGRIVNPTHPWPLPRKAFAPGHRYPPYTAVELASLERAADAPRTRARRRIFQVAMALGLGVGLDGRTLFTVFPEHVEPVGALDVIVHGPPPRPPVQVTGRLAVWLREWAADTDAGQPVIGSRGTYNTVVSSLTGDDGETRLQPGRLRSTFVVHLLETARGPVRELLEVVGVESFKALDGYLPYLAPPDPPQRLVGPLNPTNAPTRPEHDRGAAS